MNVTQEAFNLWRKIDGTLYTDYEMFEAIRIALTDAFVAGAQNDSLFDDEEDQGADFFDPLNADPATPFMDRLAQDMEEFPPGEFRHFQLWQAFFEFMRDEHGYSVETAEIEADAFMDFWMNDFEDEVV